MRTSATSTAEGKNKFKNQTANTATPGYQADLAGRNGSAEKG
jgi:hypothetical protein